MSAFDTYHSEKVFKSSDLSVLTRLANFKAGTEAAEVEDIINKKVSERDQCRSQRMCLCLAARSRMDNNDGN